MNKKFKKLLDKLLFRHFLIIGLILVFLIILIGGIIFRLVEDYSLFDSIYFITITITTIGYGDVTPLTHGGKVISLIYGFMGVPFFIGIMGLFFEKRVQKTVEHHVEAIHTEIHNTEKQVAKEAEEIEEVSKEIESTDKKLAEQEKILKDMQAKTEKKGLIKKLFKK